jgi:DNA polymerase III epsilon subunit-like protein
MRYVAILDTETTSLEPPPVGQVIEVAAMLYDVKVAQPVASFSSLIRAASNEAEHVNGIPPAMLAEARESDEVWRAVKWAIGPAEAVIAHRAEFDQQFVPDLGKPWVCSKVDLEYPGRLRGDHLVQLALGLGLGVASAHRAMADVDTLARVLTRLAERGVDLEAMIVRGMRPKALFYALVSYENRQVAKDHGFLWNEAKHGKNWYRQMPPEDVEALPFRVRLVQQRGS